MTTRSPRDLLSLPSLLRAAALVLVVACAGRTAAPPAPAPAQRMAEAATAAAAPHAADPGDRGATGPMPVDPAVRLGTLANGLRYYVRAHHKPERRAAL